MSAAYYDLHNHTLPGVDDGPRTMDDAIAMAGIAAADGIGVVLLTPHNRDVEPLVRDGSFPQRVEALRAAIAEAGIGVQIVVGMENHVEPDLPEKLAQGLALPINGSKYVLVELPFTSTLPLYTDDVLFQLQVRGYAPIIAHPERCDALAERPELLQAFVGRGMLAQVTTTSIVGGFGRKYQKAAETMLRGDLVQIIATDSHQARGPRVPVMSKGVQQAARLVGEERATFMATAVPHAIIEGRPIPALPAPDHRRRVG